MPQSPAVVDLVLKDIDLKGGVNEGFRKESVDWTKYLTKAENLVIDSYGSLVKRAGRGPIGDGPVDADGAFFTKYLRAYRLQKSTCISATPETTIGHQLYKYDEVGDRLMRLGYMPEFQVESISVPPVQNTSAAYYSTSFAVKYECSSLCVTSGGYMVAAVKNPAGYAHIHLIDKDTGGVILSHTFGNGTDNPHIILVAVGANVHVYESNSTVQRVYLLNPVARTIGAAVNLTSTAAGRQIAAALPSGSGSVVINRGPGDWTTGAVNDSYIETFNAAGASSASATWSSTYAWDASVDGSGNIHVAATVDTTGRVTVRSYSSALAVNGTVTDVATAPTTYAPLRIAVNSAGTSGRILGWRATTVATHNLCSVDVWGYTPGATAVDTSHGTIVNWSEASSPFCSATTGRYYVAISKVATGCVGTGGGTITFTRETTGQTVLVDITEEANSVGESHFRPVAVLGGYSNLNNIGDLTNGGAVYNGVSTSGMWGPAPKPASSDAGLTWHIPTTHLNTATSIGHLAHTLRTNGAEHLGNAGNVLCGGAVYYYDERLQSELGFLDRPTIIPSQGAAGGPAAGSRNYVAVYEYIGSDGEVHFSRTSPVVTWTNTGGNQISLQVTVPTVSARGDYQVRCVIYRTAASGTSYHMLTVLGGGPTGLTTVYTTYNDTMSDTDLVARAIMYRQPGVSGTALDRYPPLASQSICSHKDRVITANGSNVYYSSFKVDGEAPWFNPAFSIYIPGGSGNITGLASMDGQLFIFKRDGVWVVDGDGPPENGGTGTEFSPPRRLRIEFGCIDQRTVVVTPIGIMYRSGRGIELLSPNGQVSWVGEPVKDVVDSNPYSGGSALDISNGRVMFPMGDTEGTYPGLLTYDGLGTQNGITAVYDLAAGAWTTANYTGSNPGELGAYVQDYVYSRFDSQDRLFSLGAGGLCQHDPDSYLDNGGTQYSPFTLETGWIKWDSIQERIRVTDLLVLAKKATNHNLSVSVAYDYSDTYSYTKTWTPADINGLSLEQLELQVPKQSVQAVRFKITDSEPADTVTYPITTGKGPEILGLTVKMGLKGGGAKLASGSKG